MCESRIAYLKGRIVKERKLCVVAEVFE
jgi:hypothetical protein